MFENLEAVFFRIAAILIAFAVVASIVLTICIIQGIRLLFGQGESPKRRFHNPYKP